LCLYCLELQCHCVCCLWESYIVVILNSYITDMRCIQCHFSTVIIIRILFLYTRLVFSCPTWARRNHILKNVAHFFWFFTSCHILIWPWSHANVTAVTPVDWLIDWFELGLSPCGLDAPRPYRQALLCSIIWYQLRTALSLYQSFRWPPDWTFNVLWVQERNPDIRTIFFSQKVPANEFPPGSSTGPLWREMPVARVFFYLSSRVLSKGALPPGSHHRAPIERETSPPKPHSYISCLR
jgi:hypothetical protein